MRSRLIFSPWLALAPALALVAVLVGASLAYGVAQSMGLMAVIGQNTLSLDAYRTLLSGQGPAGREFWGALGFSLWVSLASTVSAAALALLVAVGLASQPSGGAADTLALNWNLAVPHLVWAVALLLLLAQSGLLARLAATAGLIQMPADFPVLVRDGYGLGIILHYVSKETPFLALIVLAMLRSQPTGYAQVAANLGATRWQRLRYVTLPFVLPALSAGALLVFAFVFSAYEVPALLGVGYPRLLSVLALRFFSDPDLRARADGMAVSLILTAIVLVVAAVSRRRGGAK